MRIKTYTVFLLSFFVLPAQMLAFDGQRKGFILGGGLGAGYISYEETLPELGLNRFTLSMNFKIGYAPTNNLEIYFMTDASGFFYQYQLDTDVIGMTIIGFTGGGLTVYLSPRGTGFFVSAGIGRAILDFLNTRHGAGHYDGGVGLLVGAGYDLSKHWRIQGDVVYNNMPAINTRSLGFRVTFNFLAF